MTSRSDQPAFPLHNHGAQTLGMHLTGMTMRDYFAAKAMQALLSDPQWRMSSGMYDTARSAYDIADVMMKERDK